MIFSRTIWVRTHYSYSYNRRIKDSLSELTGTSIAMIKSCTLSCDSSAKVITYRSLESKTARSKVSKTLTSARI